MRLALASLLLTGCLSGSSTEDPDAGGEFTCSAVRWTAEESEGGHIMQRAYVTRWEAADVEEATASYESYRTGLDAAPGGFWVATCR